MKNTIKTLLSISAVLGGGFAQVADAHHSFAAYDMDRAVSVSATVKQFRWGAPHSGIILIVKDAKGKEERLNLVTGLPISFVRQGITAKSVRPGDKVQVTYHPNKNGSPGGALSTLVLPDGRKYTDTESFGAVQLPTDPPEK